MSETGDLSVYDTIDPDTILKPGSMTFFYIPTTKNLYVQPYPITHKDMLEDDEDLFQDVYPGKKVNARQRETLSSRGQALLHSNALLGRIGVSGDNIILAFWSHPNPELFGNFLSKLFETHPHFRNIQDKVVVVMGGKAQPLTSLIGGKTSPKRAVSLKKKKLPKALQAPTEDATAKYQIDGQAYSLPDLQRLRVSLHTQTSPRFSPAYSVLCHPDLQKYPELQGYRPATCSNSTSVRPSHPDNWRKASRDAGLPYTYSYGEGFTFRDWIDFQDCFVTLQPKETK